VDSDVDSEVLSADGDAGDEVSDLGEEKQQEEAPEQEMDQPADEDEEIVAAVARHAPGTWKVWEDLWFYMTETLGFTDIKMHMKTPFLLYLCSSCGDDAAGTTWAETRAAYVMM
jgi:hypothetical protein